MVVRDKQMTNQQYDQTLKPKVQREVKSFHALSHYFTINQVCHRTNKDQVQRHPGIPNGSQLRVRRDIFRVTRRLRGVAVAPEMYPVTCKSVVSLFRPIIVYKFLFPSSSGLKV